MYDSCISGGRFSGHKRLTYTGVLLVGDVAVYVDEYPVDLLDDLPGYYSALCVC